MTNLFHHIRNKILYQDSLPKTVTLSSRKYDWFISSYQQLNSLPRFTTQNSTLLITRKLLIYLVISGTKFSTKFHHPKCTPLNTRTWLIYFIISGTNSLPRCTTQNCTPLITRIWQIYFVLSSNKFCTKVHHPKLYPSHNADMTDLFHHIRN